MTDSDDKVAINAVIALGNIVVNNLDAEQQPALPVETVSLIMQAMLQRVSICLQNGNVKDADKMLTALMNTVSMSDDQIFEQIPALVTLCEQIMASDFPEDTKKITVRIFTEIVEVSAEVRKQLRDMLQNFIRNYVIPRLVPGEEVIQNWLSSEKDFVFEDNTMQDVCEKCVEAAAFSQGKQIMNPLLHDVV